MHAIRRAVLDAAVLNDSVGAFHPQVTAGRAGTPIFDGGMADDGHCRGCVRPNEINPTPGARCRIDRGKGYRLFGRSGGDEPARHIQGTAGNETQGHARLDSQRFTLRYGETVKKIS